MVIEKEINLSRKTTFGLGPICHYYYTPESVGELIELFRKFPTSLLLAGGSNVVIDDRVPFDTVISLLKFDASIVNNGNGLYKVGASVRNQTLINSINKDGYGGIEYLVSVPGTIGGAIYMNAGTGKELSQYISQYVISVEWFNGEEIISLTRDECEFAYRYSIFQKQKGIILGATFQFPQMSFDESKKRILERQERVKRLQDHSGKTCGTFCKISDRNVMRLLKVLQYGNKDGIHFSSKTSNWLINGGEGDFNQFCKCLNVAKRLHLLFNRKIELEIEVWKK